MAVFTWEPLTKPEGSVRFRVAEARFGDGYSQVAADGLNTRLTDWSLSFEGTYDEMIAITDFLDNHAGHIAFQWTPPGRVQGWYLCKRYTEVPHVGAQKRVNTTFEQVFRP